MYLKVVNNQHSRKIPAMMLGSVNMLHASNYDPDFDISKYTLIVAFPQNLRCIFAMHIRVELQ
jgi:hypothetical protein